MQTFLDSLVVRRQSQIVVEWFGCLGLEAGYLVVVYL